MRLPVALLALFCLPALADDPPSRSPGGLNSPDIRTFSGQVKISKIQSKYLQSLSPVRW